MSFPHHHHPLVAKPKLGAKAKDMTHSQHTDRMDALEIYPSKSFFKASQSQLANVFSSSGDRIQHGRGRHLRQDPSTTNSLPWHDAHS